MGWRRFETHNLVDHNPLRQGKDGSQKPMWCSLGPGQSPPVDFLVWFYCLTNRPFWNMAFIPWLIILTIFHKGIMWPLCLISGFCISWPSWHHSLTLKYLGIVSPWLALPTEQSIQWHRLCDSTQRPCFQYIQLFSISQYVSTETLLEFHSASGFPLPHTGLLFIPLFCLLGNNVKSIFYLFCRYSKSHGHKK